MMDIINASKQGDYNSVKSILKHGASERMLATPVSQVEPTPLALVSGERVKRVDPNIQNKYGYTAIYWALLKGHKDVVELLLKHGANPNLKDNRGYTAMCASLYGHKDIVDLVDIVELLLKYILKHCIDPSKICLWLKKAWILENIN